MIYDVVLRGGRVIDPESGLDAVMEVAISDRSIAAVASEPLDAHQVVDVSGHVVAPGFVDLHSHGQAIPEQRLQALDGVTTALELEAGSHPVEAAYDRAASEGRPIHYGFSASWAAARMRTLMGVSTQAITGLLGHLGDGRWQVPATPDQIDAIVELLRADLDAGALGIGVLVAYAPLCDPTEYLRVAGLAAEAGVPTYTHARDLVEVGSEPPIDGATEIVRAAAETGAHMHYCHINSTSGRHIDRVHGLVERVRAEGSTVTTEAYPYGAGMTAIGAAFLSPERLRTRGVGPDAIGYAPTGEWISDWGRLEQLRRDDPGGLAFVAFLRDERPDDFAWIEEALAWPDTAVASDAMPIHWPDGVPDPGIWPLPAGGISHPRGAGCFSRVLRMAREGRLFDLAQAVDRSTIVPVRVLEGSVPAMRKKGRIQAGCDADIVVFDPDTVSDQATYTDTLRPATGIAHVLVDGTWVVRGGSLQTDALPGRPLRAHDL